MISIASSGAWNDANSLEDVHKKFWWKKPNQLSRQRTNISDWLEKEGHPSLSRHSEASEQLAGSSGEQAARRAPGRWGTDAESSARGGKKKPGESRC